MQFDKLKTALNNALDNFDKQIYRDLILTTDLAMLTEDEQTIVKKWITREKAMIEIEKQQLSKILNEQTVIFDRATEDDPDYYYPPQREHAYTPGVDDYLIAVDHIQQLRVLSYAEFIEQFLSNKESP